MPSVSAIPTCEHLKLSVSNGRLDLIFNRPDQRNAINTRMGEEIGAVVHWLAGNASVRVVVLHGAGGNFCAGGDIKERRNMAEEAIAGQDPLMERNRQAGLSFLAFERLPQTTVAAVQGAAFGGGLGYACLADITIVTRGARLGMPETTLGVAPAQIAPYVVKRIGLTRARQLALTGECFGGAQAYEYGVAQYLCDDDALDSTVNNVVSRILNCGPMANAVTKQIMLRVGRLPDEEMVAYSAQQFAALNRSEEGREGQSAFADKRKPTWQTDQ